MTWDTKTKIMSEFTKRILCFPGRFGLGGPINILRVGIDWADGRENRNRGTKPRGSSFWTTSSMKIAFRYGTASNSRVINDL
jgi:hypothetical protein